jgi:hypothetical protein
MRRSTQALEEAVAKARGQRERALACYRLGVFHDNNGREAVAIGCYRRALRLGLSAEVEGAARAWLTSSLWKTGQVAAARREWRRAADVARGEVARFLERLGRKLDRAK